MCTKTTSPHSFISYTLRSALGFFCVCVCVVVVVVGFFFLNEFCEFIPAVCHMITLIYKISLFFTSRNEMCQFLCKLSC